MTTIINSININNNINFQFSDTIKEITLKGREAQTLYSLIKAGDKGATAQELSSWALRLASYVFNLKRKYGIDIRTLRERNSDGIGTHGRYFLKDNIEIIGIN